MKDTISDVGEGFVSGRRKIFLARKDVLNMERWHAQKGSFTQKYNGRCQLECVVLKVSPAAGDWAQLGATSPAISFWMKDAFITSN